MSTPDFDFAPPGATATAPPPAAVQPPASGAASPTDPGAQQTQRRRSTSQKDDNLSGVLIPGGVIAGLISLCWLIHTFGLPVIIFALLAAAATAAAAVVIKVSRRAAKSASRNRLGRGAGGGGPGRRGGQGAGGGRSGSGRLSAGNGSGGAGSSRRSGGGSRGSNTPGALSRKPAGLGSVKSPSGRSGATNSSRGGLGDVRSTAGPKPLKGSLNKGGLGSGLGGGQDKSPKAPKTPGANGSRGGLLNRWGLGSGTGTGRSPDTNRKAGGAGAGGTGAGGTTAPKTPKGTTGPGGTKAPKKPEKTTGGGKSGGKGKGKGGKAKAPRHRRYTWRKNPIRKTGNLAKATATKTKKAAKGAYKTVTSKKFRRRMHKVATPFRATYRGTRKHGGKLLANVMRVGGRWMLSVNSALGSIRHSTMGPNWLKPLSKVLFWATSPLAKLVNVSRSWSWLNAWVYKTATARPLPKPAAATTAKTPTVGAGTPAPAPTSGGHAPVPSPATTSAGGTPVDTTPVHHAYPLIYAADAIRMAAAALAAAPADSMKGYEATIENLGHLEFAMCQLLLDIAQVTEDDFKVNPEIPNQYRNLGIHFLALGAFVDSAHKVFREVHAEQLENIENPTWQGRKWDISANWAHIMPQFAWQDPTTHVVPLLLASGAIRDAGIHIRLHPSGSMFGYEMTIEHLAPLAEALYELMETVATTTEAEFSVHPAVTAMHRDAGLRFRDLGGAIQAVHFLYRLLHQEQLLNLENPTYQAAKWDADRNAS
ncbi:hypothetical protein WKI65_43675 [Streptomyces sp. MS1.AVA.3]|uniref:hypothetical protein n=1 Tax=Streptomyces decoyicus TaxID=249567 RepID=UPI0030BC665F